MEAMYVYVKYVHLFFVTMTITLVNLRFFMRTMLPEKKLPIVFKFLPHINDSFLLFSGMLMMQIIPWHPFGENKWLGIKLLLVLTYIIVGAMCLRARPRSRRWWTCYALAMSCVATIVYLAHWKPI